MNRDAKTLSDWVLEHPGLVPESIVDAAERLHQKRRSRKKVASGRMKPSRADYKAQTAALREKVIALARISCERCQRSTLPAMGHMHHLQGGSGRRRQEQNITNVAWLCGDCHRTLHEYPEVNRMFAAWIRAKRG